MTRRNRDDQGSTAVELAMVLPVTLALLGAIFTLALTMTYSALAEHAARSGLRTAVVYVPGGYADQAAVQSKVDSLFPTKLLGNGTVTADPSLTSAAALAGAQGDQVTVTVTYSVPGISKAADLIPDIPLFSSMRSAFKDLATVKRTATGRRE